MSTTPSIHIRRRLDSETLHLPELKELVGKYVEIVVSEEFPPQAGRAEQLETLAQMKIGELAGDAFDGFDDAVARWRAEPWSREED